MTVEKCKSRQSKTNPYSREKLMEIVKENGLSLKEARGLNKEDLCKYIYDNGVELTEFSEQVPDLVGRRSSNVGRKKKSSKSEPKIKMVKHSRKSKRVTFDIPQSQERPCGIRKTKSNNAYSKLELVKMAVAKGIKRGEASKMKIKDLCALIFTTRRKAFNSRKCSEYSVNQILEYAKDFKISSSDFDANCEDLISSLHYKLKEKCNESSLEDLKSLAEERSLSVDGTKDELCSRILDWEKDNVLSDLNKTYIKFVKGFEKSAELSHKDIRKYLQRKKYSVDKSFSEMVEKMSKNERKDLIEALKTNKEIHPSFVLKSFIQRQTEESCSGGCDLPYGNQSECKRVKDLPCIKNSKLTLKHHQKVVVNHILKHHGLIAVHGVGSGKTLTAVTAIMCVLSSFPKMKVVIVTPTSLELNMKKEFIKYGANSDNPRIAFFTTQKFVNIYGGSEYKLKDTFLIIDEAHNLKTAGGSRANAFIEASKYVSKILLLTATPIINTETDIVNLLRMVDPHSDLTAYYFNRYIKGNRSSYDRLFKCKFSYFKCDRKEDYPSFDEHYVDIVMDQNYYRLYRDLELNERDKIDLSLFTSNSDSDLQVFFNGLRRGVNNLDEDNSQKVKWVIDKVKEGKKTLIYSNFLNAGQRLIINQLKKHGVKYDVIDGSMPQNKRKAAVDKYNDDEIKVLIISKAGGEGLDLKATRNVIILDPTWNWGSIEQITGRAIRYKSHSELPPEERHVDIYYLRLLKPETLYTDDDNPQTIDEYLYVNMIEPKKKMMEDMMEDIERNSIERNDCD